MALKLIDFSINSAVDIERLFYIDVWLQWDVESSKSLKKAVTPTLILRLFVKLPEDERMSEMRPRWENEPMGGIPANPRACETCMFRASEFNGVKLDRADTANCQIYEPPESKPNDVYWNGADCESYEKAV